MSKINITRVKISSVGKLLGSLNGLIALLFGVITAIVATVSVIAENNYSVLGNIFVALAVTVVSLVVYPLVGFAFGWLYGALLAVVWNVVLGVSGGLEIETEQVKEPKEEAKK